MALEVRIPICKIISLIRIEKSPLTIKKKQSKVNNSSLSHRNFQRRKDKTVNKGTMKQKPKNNINRNAISTTAPVSHLFREHHQ
jgi:hypothetical protein